MKKQVIAIGVAAALALLAVVALVVYAKGANDRALEGTETVEVLQATSDIGVKTAVADLADKVELVKIPKAAEIPGAVTSLEDLEGQVTKVALVAGDQLSTAKFDQPDSVKGPASLPDGMQELAIQIDGERFLGGAVSAGDTLGVFVSFTLDTGAKITGNPINNLLVLKVDNGVAGSENAAGTIVTVAVTQLQAEQIIHAKEFGTIWMTRQNDTTDLNGGGTITWQDVTPFGGAQ